MKISRKYKRWILTIITLLAIFFSIITVIYINLPFVIENQRLRLAELLGISKLKYSIDQANINNLNISSLKIQNKTNSGIEVDKIDLIFEDFTIKSLNIDGLKLNIAIKNNKISIPGFKNQRNRSNSKKPTPFKIPTFLHKDFKLSLIKSIICLEFYKKTNQANQINIPFSIDLKRDNNLIEFKIKTENIPQPPKGIYNSRIEYLSKNIDISLQSFEFFGKIIFKNNIPTFFATIKISDLNIEEKEQEFSINNLNLNLNIINSNLNHLRTPQSQEISFDKLKYKTFSLNKGKILFQAESLKSFLIEKGEFEWCDGNVTINSFPIKSDKFESIDLVLYCDRVKIASVLNQFNVGKASGEGRITGKIPLIYNNQPPNTPIPKSKNIDKKINNINPTPHDRGIRINNGFLYSTPGVGGNISLTDFMGSLASIPNLLQIDITREALKDFNYDWIKLNLNSEKDELLITLAISGTPAKLLPFAFDSKKGGLYKSLDKNKKANFKGISFQINFRLPLNKIMKYGTKFEELTEY